MRTTVKLIPFAVCLSALFVGNAQAQTGDFIGTFGAWNAFADKENGKKLCYVASLPEKSEGNYSERGDTYSMITLRPGVSSVGEMSIRAGYTYKPGSDTEVRIDSGQPFKMFTDGGYSWARDSKSDKAMIGAMKAGGTMIVKGTSARGTLTTDTYSLNGFTAAFKAITKACGTK